MKKSKPDDDKKPTVRKVSSSMKPAKKASTKKAAHSVEDDEISADYNDRPARLAPKRLARAKAATKTYIEIFSDEEEGSGDGSAFEDE
jgi:hypothetical protein